MSVTGAVVLTALTRLLSGWFGVGGGLGVDVCQQNSDVFSVFDTWPDSGMESLWSSRHFSLLNHFHWPKYGDLVLVNVYGSDLNSSRNEVSGFRHHVFWFWIYRLPSTFFLSCILFKHGFCWANLWRFKGKISDFLKSMWWVIENVIKMFLFVCMLSAWVQFIFLCLNA